MSNEIYPFKTKRAYNFARKFTQVGHGLAIGDQVNRDATETWVLALADAVANLKNGMIEAVDGDDFVVVYAGLVTIPAHGFTVNQSYFLSQATPGAVVAVQPLIGLAQACFEVMDSETLYVEHQAVINNA